MYNQWEMEPWIRYSTVTTIKAFVTEMQEEISNHKNAEITVIYDLFNKVYIAECMIGKNGKHITLLHKRVVKQRDLYPEVSSFFVNLNGIRELARRIQSGEIFF